MSKKNNYIDNEKFQEAIIEYRKACEEAKEQNKDRPVMPNYIAECFVKIANGYFLKPRFRSYSYEDDMKSEAIITCIKYFDTYDPKRRNPFAWFTAVVHNAFLQVINAEERNRYKIIKNFTTNVLVGNEKEIFESNLLKSEDVYDNMYSFISSYEDREKAKKIRKKTKSLLKGVKDGKKDKCGEHPVSGE